MKLILGLIIALALPTFADGPGGVGVRHAVLSPLVLDTSSTNVTSSAYVTFSASLANSCSAIQIHNTGAQPIKLATGVASSEVDTGVIFPIGVSILIPQELKKGVRLSVRSMGSTQSSGLLLFSCFQ